MSTEWLSTAEGQVAALVALALLFAAIVAGAALAVGYHRRDDVPPVSPDGGEQDLDDTGEQQMVADMRSRLARQAA